MSNPVQYQSLADAAVAAALNDDDQLVVLKKNPTTGEYTVQRIDKSAVGLSGGGGTAVRQTITFSTANGQTQGEVLLSKTALLLYVHMTQPCRLRMYCDASARVNDQPRQVSTFPNTNSGLMFEFVGVPGLLQAPLSPGVVAFNNDQPTTDTQYWTVDSDTAVDITLTYVEIE